MHSAHHGDIRKVRAAKRGMVGEKHFARLNGTQRSNGAHARSKRTQVNRNVWGVGAQSAVGSQDAAGKIQSILDVDTARAA